MEFQLRGQSWLLIIMLLTRHQALAWNEDGPNYFFMDCKKFPRNGADQIYLRITPESGSYGVPYLVGIKDNVELWSHRYPAEDVNLAKIDYSCFNNTIKISSADPGPTISTEQVFTWDGTTLSRSIRFGRGEDYWTAYKTVSAGQIDNYHFVAKKGQRLKIIASSTIYSPTIISIYNPKTNILIKAIETNKNDATWVHTLEVNGEYRLTVAGVSEKSGYYIRLWID